MLRGGEAIVFRAGLRTNRGKRRRNDLFLPPASRPFAIEQREGGGMWSASGVAKCAAADLRTKRAFGFAPMIHVNELGPVTFIVPLTHCTRKWGIRAIGYEKSVS